MGYYEGFVLVVGSECFFDVVVDVKGVFEVLEMFFDDFFNFE